MTDNLQFSFNLFSSISAKLSYFYQLFKRSLRDSFKNRTKNRHPYPIRKDVTIDSLIKRFVKFNDVNELYGDFSILDCAQRDRDELMTTALTKAGAFGTLPFSIIGHSLGLKGFFSFSNKTGIQQISYEGLCTSITIPVITKHLIKFNESFQNNPENDVVEKQAVKIATESFDTMFQDDQSYYNINQFIRYNAKLPIVTPINTDDHTMSAVLYKELLGLVNKSEGIVFSIFDSSLLKKPNEFNSLLKFMKEGVNKLDVMLHHLAYWLKPLYIGSYLTKPQTVGNCSYKNIKGGFQGILLALQLDAQMLEDKAIKGEVLSDDEKQLLIYKDLDHKKITSQFSYSDVIQSIDEHYNNFKNTSAPNKWHPFFQFFTTKYDPNKPRHIGIMNHINSKFGTSLFKSNFPKLS